MCGSLVVVAIVDAVVVAAIAWSTDVSLWISSPRISVAVAAPIVLEKQRNEHCLWQGRTPVNCW